jgi:putative endonuclease
MNRDYFVYILTNWKKNVLYVGVTNDISRRLHEHVSGAIPGFTKKYNCKELIYYEQFDYINNAISREKEIKGWRRDKKNQLIVSFNPEWKSFNNRFIRTTENEFRPIS